MVNLYQCHQRCNSDRSCGLRFVSFCGSGGARLIVVLLLLLVGVWAGSGVAFAQDGTPEPTLGPPGPTHTPQATSVPADSWQVKVCWSPRNGIAGAPEPVQCSVESAGNQQAGMLWSGMMPSGGEGSFGISSIQIINAPQWVVGASLSFSCQSYRGGMVIPSMATMGIWPNDQWWGYGQMAKFDNPGAENCNPAPCPSGHCYECWSGFRNASAYVVVDWCLHPNWRIPLNANGPVNMGGLQVVYTGSSGPYRCQINVTSTTPKRCDLGPTPTLTVGPSPTWRSPLTPFPTRVETVQPWPTMPGWPTQIPYPTQLPYPTHVPYPSPVGWPTPNATPVVRIGDGTSAECHVVLRDMELHQSFLGRSVDWDFAGLQLCTVDYSLEMWLWDIPIGRFLLAALAIGLAGVIYAFIRT